MATEAIYIDANRLIAGSELGTLKTEAANLGITLFAPEIAVLELVKNRLESAKNCCEQIKKSNATLGHLTGQEAKSEASFAELRDFVKPCALNFIQSNGILPVPTPTDIVPPALELDLLTCKNV